ncbi:regulator of ribonuclease activity B [Luteibacter rhizovicinus]|uniref:Regulator of ribonuclease activity B n=1 Tax=Luteibacter rhizovicinus TaxID=242606 RepID=A0A4R3YP77_9GAMM|nr:regulator of ribonuclease activity B [Luteibacter rhizovicinus]
MPRDVDFLMRAPSHEKATVAAGFINDHQYGVATTQKLNGEHTVSVTIHMAIQQHVVLSVSGFMECVASLFGLDYDGWGCTAQKHQP